MKPFSHLKKKISHRREHIILTKWRGIGLYRKVSLCQEKIFLIFMLFLFTSKSMFVIDFYSVNLLTFLCWHEQYTAFLIF